MIDLQHLIDDHVSRGTAPGIVVADGAPGRPVEFLHAGDLPVDAVVRIQSMTKPVLAVAALRLVDAGGLGLDDPVERWLPELSDRRVLRTPIAPLDDTVPAERPITVRHLLTNMSGYGMIAEDCPLHDAMVANGTEADQDPVSTGADDWLAAVAELPLAFQPGAGWRYHHSFGLLGILLSRLVGGDLDGHLRTDLFDPLGMTDTAHVVPRAEAHRLPAAHRHAADGLIETEPAGEGFYVAPPPFDVSHAELVSTARDYAVFARMLASGGEHEGRTIVQPGLLREMLADQVPTGAKTPESFFPGFWDGMGWGFGVAVHTSGPRSGRFGWSGGLGTDFWAEPAGAYRVVLTQVEMGPKVMGLFADLQE